MTTSKTLKNNKNSTNLYQKHKWKDIFLPIAEVKYLIFDPISILKLGHSTLMCPLKYSDENISSYKTVFYVQDLIYKQH